MSESRGARRVQAAIWWLGSGILCLLVAYVLSYFLLVQVVRTGHIYAAYHAEYRVGSQAAEYFFWPIHQVDRKLRPGIWDTVVFG